MDSVEKSAKTVEEAISEGLKTLNADIGSVDVNVIDPGSKGILGLGSKPARVRLTLKYDPVGTASKFIRQMCLAMGIPVKVEAEIKDKTLMIELSGSDMGVLIGKRGQTLDSIQYLVNLVVNKGENPYLSVSIDSENYRKRRKETLETLALNIAKKVKATRKPMELEPMNPYERRIIHSALQGDHNIATTSKGEEPYRHIVISYKR